MLPRTAAGRVVTAFADPDVQRRQVRQTCGLAVALHAVQDQFMDAQSTASATHPWAVQCTNREHGPHLKFVTAAGLRASSVYGQKLQNKMHLECTASVGSKECGAKLICYRVRVDEAGRVLAQCLDGSSRELPPGQHLCSMHAPVILSRLKPDTRFPRQFVGAWRVTMHGAPVAQPDGLYLETTAPTVVKTDVACVPMLHAHYLEGAPVGFNPLLFPLTTA